MEFRFIISTIFEIALGGFIIWGIFNEKKLVAFEERIMRKLKKRVTTVRVRNGRNCKKNVA